MNRVYGIFAVVGWVWAAVVAVFLWVKLPAARASLRPSHNEPGPPEDGQQNERQH